MENHFEKLDKVKCFLLDMDGTVYLDDTLFEKVKEVIDKMRQRGKIIFLTNNSSKSKKVYIEKLNKIGIPISDDEIYTSGMATIEYLNYYYPNASIYLLGSDALKEEFKSNGIALNDVNPDLVVLGYDTDLRYSDLCKFTNFLHEGKTYIATHPDINCPASPYYVIDIGAMIEMIYASTKRRPDVIIGKPYKIMGENIKRKYQLSDEQIAMIGDRWYTDIKFANNNNFVSILTLSGETTLIDAFNSDANFDIIIKEIKDLLDYL